MSKSNIKKYRSDVDKVAYRAILEAGGYLIKNARELPPCIFPLAIRFVQRGRFTTCYVRARIGCTGNQNSYKRTGIGFAHRMWGDKPNPEIGKLVALSRAVRDALAIELSICKNGVTNGNV